jgi:nucleoside-diphosphate-sugar epimerase
MSGSSSHTAAASRAIDGAINAAKAAHKAGIKRFVYTSSSFAVTQPKPNVEFTITTESWNDEAVEKCEKGEADGATIYAASKVKAERALFVWVKENAPGMVVNSRKSDLLSSVWLHLVGLVAAWFG